MSKGLLFWILMVIWFLFGLYFNVGSFQAGNYYAGGSSLLLFALLFLLGWQVFGFVVKD